MVDYSVDETFDLYLTETNSIAEVDGRDEFEENLVVELDYQLSDGIGNIKNRDTFEERAQLLATRIAEDFDVIESIRRLNVSELTKTSETLSLEIIYISGERFDETI